jgi:hypothetical protein
VRELWRLNLFSQPVLNVLLSQPVSTEQLYRLELIFDFVHQSNNSLEDFFIRSFPIELTEDVKCTEAIAVLVLIGLTFRFVSLW